MKSLLKINIYLILCLYISIVVFGKSEDSIIYNVFFKNTGFKFDIYNTVSSGEILEKTEQNIFIETFSNPSNVFLNDIKHLNYKTVFFVCNSEYIEEGLFECSSSKFNFINNSNFKYEKIVLSDSKNNEKTELHLISGENISFFVINEKEFSSVEKKTLLTTYFKSINRSLSIGVDNPNVTEKTFKQNFDGYLNSTSFELVTYSLLTLLILIFFGKIIIYFKNNYKNIDLIKLKELSQEFVFGSFSQNIYAKTFISLIFIFYIFLIFQYIPDYIGSKTQFLRQLVEKAINFNFFEELSNSNYSDLIFFTYTYFVLFVVFVTRLDVVTYFIQNQYSKFIARKISSNSLKYLFVFVYILSLILLVNFIKTLSFEFLFFILILNLFTISVIYKEKIELYSLFSFNQKLVLITGTIFVTLGFFFFQTYFVRPSFRYDNLIGISDSIVSLPYKKQTSGNVLFNNLEEYKINYPLFIEEYLIFHNKFEKIENKNVKNFNEDDSNFIVTAKSQDRLLRGLLSNSKIFEKLSSSNKSRLIYLENKGLKDLSLKVTVNCSDKTSTNFNIKAYYLENNKNFKNTEYILGNLLGCNKDSSEYVFKLPKELIEESNIVIEVLDKNPKFVDSISFLDLETNENISYKYLSIINNLYFYVNSSKGSNSDKFTNYFVNEKKEYSFESKNITENLNQLVKDKSVGNVFNIWSLEPFRIIVNEFDLE